MKTFPTPQKIHHSLFAAFALIAVFVLCWGQQFSITHYCPSKATVVSDVIASDSAAVSEQHDCSSSEQLLTSSVTADFTDVVLYAAALLIVVAMFYLQLNQAYRRHQRPRPHPPYQTLYCSYLE